MTHPTFEMLNLSNKQRVFVCGDIHGMFRDLEYELLEVNFNIDTDVLICVGDLVDRGTHSELFEEYLKKPWFKRVLGNHDLQPREFLLGFESERNVYHNGGEWFLDKPKEEQERIASLLEDGPLAIEVLTPGGKRVGITHADMGGSWNNLEECLRYPTKYRFMVNLLTGSREMIKVVQGESSILTLDDVPVEGIDHVFHGHTPIDDPITYANRTWIDTCAFDPRGRLTVIDIDEFLNNL